jgi:hypothetical protein
MKTFFLIFRVAMVPIIVTFCTVLFWKFFHQNVCSLFHIQHGINTIGQELSSDLIVLMPNLFYSVLEGFIINSVMQKHYEIKSAIKTYNAEQFLAKRDNRILPLIHVILFMTWVGVMLCAFLYPYSSDPIGMLVIGIFSFLGIFGLAVAIELDDPFSGIWKFDRKRIPQGWMTMTMQDIINEKVPDAKNPKSILGIEE